MAGHWEGDLITGEYNGSAIGTLVERTTRFVMLLHLPGAHTADAVRDALIRSIGTLPAQIRRSLTWDQGKEMARHLEFTMAADMPVFFCDPHRPVAAWLEREHQRSPASVLSEEHESVDSHRGGPRHRRRGTQCATAKNPRLAHSG